MRSGAGNTNQSKWRCWTRTWRGWSSDRQDTCCAAPCPMPSHWWGPFWHLPPLQISNDNRVLAFFLHPPMQQWPWISCHVCICFILKEFFQDGSKPENVGVYNLSKGVNRFCLSKPGFFDAFVFFSCVKILFYFFILYKCWHCYIAPCRCVQSDTTFLPSVRTGLLHLQHVCIFIVKNLQLNFLKLLLLNRLFSYCSIRLILKWFIFVLTDLPLHMWNEPHHTLLATCVVSYGKHDKMNIDLMIKQMDSYLTAGKSNIVSLTFFMRLLLQYD